MEETPSLDLEELYETKQKMDVNRLNIYNKLLRKVHSRIKTASRQRENNQFCWFVMPELLVGYPNYNTSECLLYIVSQLEKDGFLTRYVHPNLLLITWNHYVPQYVRDEIKTKTGINVDKYGQKIEPKQSLPTLSSKQEKHSVNARQKTLELQGDKFKKKPNNVDHFQPTGKFLYDSKFFDSIQKNIK
jgi:hypothetical protein